MVLAGKILTFKNMLAAAFFDYDGTLANTDSVHHECWNDVLAPFEVHFDEAFYSRHCSGALSLNIAEKILLHFPGLSLKAKARDLADEKDARYQTAIATQLVALMPYVTNLLEWLGNQGIPMGVVTGAPRSAIEPTLRQHGLFDRFSVIVTRENVSQGKPAPEGYQLAVCKLGLASPKHCVAFEDTRDGIIAAKGAGLVSIAIPHAYTADHDFSEADHIVPSLNGAIPWLEASLRLT